MQPASAPTSAHQIYHADRCRHCHEAVDRDFLNQYGECRECVARNFADYVDDHPHAKQAELMAEGRRSGLDDAQIKLMLSIHRMTWSGQ